MRLTLAVIALLYALMIAGLAAAQEVRRVVCSPRAEIVARLADRYGEALAGFGLRSDVMAVEIWIDPQDGSFTVLQSTSGGQACLLVAGKSWTGPVPVLPGTIN